MRACPLTYILSYTNGLFSLSVSPVCIMHELAPNSFETMAYKADERKCA